MKTVTLDLSQISYDDDGPIEFNSYLYGTISVWREIKELDIYTAKGFLGEDARWGHGETPEEAAKDLLRELSYADVEQYDAKYEVGGDISGPVPSLGNLVPPTWIEAASNLTRQMASRPTMFRLDVQPNGTVIRIKGSTTADPEPHGWVYEKISTGAWVTTALEDEYADHTVQAEANAHGFDLLYTPEVLTK
jgi:hypothetical protein